MREAMPEAAGSARSVASAAASVAQRLSAAGVERPRADAEELLRAASGLSREALLLHPEATLSGGQLRQLEAMASRRAAREPLAYVLGEGEFYSLTFRMAPSAMVPRPETEVLAETAIEQAQLGGVRLAVDVGTGCGGISVVLARHMSEVRVLATDISLEALALARENCQRHGVGGRVRLVCGDLLEAVGTRADCVVANLPYVRRDEFAGVEPEVRDFEPRVALDGGEDGMGLIRRLSGQLFEHLSEGGFAALEVGAGQAREAAKLLEAGGLSDIEIVTDYAGIERVVIGWRRG